jgi:tRNA threonylcarbamoyladenosine biosynthesis protein TsaE
MVRATLSSPAVTGRSARTLAGVLPVPALVTLEGELGTGKTTLVRGLLRAFGVRGAVTSPSFTLVQSYRGRDGLVLHHLDLYRLGPGTDVDLFSWDDYLDAEAVVFVEWPEAGAARLPAADVAIHLYHDTPRSRRLELHAAPALERACVAALCAAGAASVVVVADEGAR